jgi:Ca2+-transporting ATPase
MAGSSPETATYEGLTSEVARTRLGEVGRNEITGAQAKAPLAILAGQFASPLIWVLFGASVVSALLREWIDAIAIGVILLPLQILWINLMTDGFPALALVMDPPDADILTRLPRRPDEPMLGRPEWRLILRIGIILAATTLLAFLWGLAHRSVAEARTLAFSTLVFGHVFMALAFRSQSKLLWEVGPFTNLRLLAVVAISILLQICLLVLPAAQRIFQITPLSPMAEAGALLWGLAPISLIELAKLVRRPRSR